MKNKNITKGYPWLIAVSIISVVAGLTLLIVPDEISLWIIRVIGLVWIIEGSAYVLEIWLKIIKTP